jgi:DNA-binding NarL/FixJ family response regulator
MPILNVIDSDTSESQAEGCCASVARLVPRILLADDQEEILRTVAKMLEDEFDVVGFAENGTQVIDLALKRLPDVLVLDICMPIMNGIDTAERLKASGCPAKLLFLTALEDADFVETAISTGALGYVLKPHLATDLIPAIRSVLQGRLYIAPTMRWS